MRRGKNLGIIFISLSFKIAVISSAVSEQYPEEPLIEGFHL